MPTDAIALARLPFNARPIRNDPRRLTSLSFWFHYRTLYEPWITYRTFPNSLHENQCMLSDDVYRERLEKTLVELETWANSMRGSADVTINASERYWRMAVTPWLPSACPFELLIKSDQTFDLVLKGEIYEGKPVERFDLFLQLAKAIASGHVERIEIRNSETGVLIDVATRIELAPGWDWIGSRKVLKHSARLLEANEERQTRRFLSYDR